MKRAVSILIRVLFTGLILGIGFISFWAWTYSRDLPNLNTLEGLKFHAGSPQPLHWSVPSSTNAIFDSKPVPLENIVPLMLSAIVSSEDRRFYDHAGFDLVGLGRSLFETALGHHQGGSTITTQLVRSTILKPQKNLKRKVQELWLSNQLEQRLSKAEILTGYINTVYWGGQLYGIRAAAKAYFGKSPRALTLPRAFTLRRCYPPQIRGIKIFGWCVTMTSRAASSDWYKIGVSPSKSHIRRGSSLCNPRVGMCIMTLKVG